MNGLSWCVLPVNNEKKKRKKQLGSSERLILIRKWVSWLQIIPTGAVCEGGGAERDIMFRVVIEKLINSNTFFFGRNLFWGGAQQSLEVQQPRDD